MHPPKRCRIVVGRLFELDAGAGYRTVADVDDMIFEMRSVVSPLPESQRLVVIADGRACQVYTPEVAERVASGMLAVLGGRSDRTAVLHDKAQPTAMLQSIRLVKEAAAPHRRIFTDPAAAQRWLAELLSEAERQRLRAFLSRPR